MVKQKLKWRMIVKKITSKQNGIISDSLGMALETEGELVGSQWGEGGGGKGGALSASWPAKDLPASGFH